jgi:phenylalanyl-tRNA synthetase beta chain
MVYVHAKHSELNRYIGKKLSVEEIENTLIDLGMDIKGKSDEKDIEFKIEITAEKMEYISSIGIARAIQHFMGIKKKIKKYEIKKGKYEIKYDNSLEKVRPKIVGAIIRNFDVTEENLDKIIEIQEKIHDSFGRNRKKVSIGVYPLKEIEFPITFKGEKPNKIKFRPLESEKEMSAEEILEKHEIGKKYAHLIKNSEVYPILVDSKNKILSMPPIINSYETGRVVPGKNDLFIDCTGHNLTHLDNVLKVLVTTLIEISGEVESVVVDYGKEKYELNLDNTKDKIDINFVNEIIGIKITPQETEKLLEKMCYKVNEIKDNIIEIEIPPFRSDVWHDVDIADDIARAYGYNNIKPKLPEITSNGELLKKSLNKEKISENLIGMGFIELYTYMLTSTEVQYNKMKRKNENIIKIIDSAEEGINTVRTLILPENLISLNINRKNNYPQKVFENGFTIQNDENQEHLCVSIADPKANYTKIKEVFDLLNKINNWNLEIKEKEFPFLIKGRSAAVIYKNKEIGFIGEIHPEILDNFGLLVPVTSFELNIKEIIEE